ncbi:MAG: efflux RND transporter permease subunit [Pseudomonadota bacterium]
MSSPGFLGRPLGVLALFAALALGGLFCWPRLAVELLPRLPYPRLTVVTTYENAPPQEVEALVTRRLEGVLGTVAGLRRLDSLSAEGFGQMTLVFEWGRDLAQSAAEVREKLDSVADQLPREAQPPLVLHYDPSEAPAVTLALTGPAGGGALRDLASEVLKPRLETLAGVAAVRLGGGLVPEVQIEADLARLVATGLELGALVERVKQANLNAPAGELRLGKLMLPVRTVGRFNSLADIPPVPLKEPRDGAVVTLGEVAQVRAGHKDQEGFARVDGRPAVLLMILKEAGANTVGVSQRVRDRAQELADVLPAGWGLAVVDDQAPFIADSLSQLRDAVLFGALLAFGVLLWFLRRPGAALLVVLAVPVSLLTTLAVMYVAKVELNLMSIGGLALGVGMLVDGSIVVLEAYERHRAALGEPLAAARTALREVRSGLVTATLTTVAVLLPVLFLGGLAQRLFVDFAFTLVTSLLTALAVALFLLPAMLVWRGRAAKPRPQPGPSRRYGAWLNACLARPWLPVALGLVAVAAGAAGLYTRGAALLPEVQASRLLVQLRLPPESGLQVLEEAADRAEAWLKSQPEIESLVTRGGVEPVEAGQGQPNQEPGRAHEVLITVKLKDGAGQGRAAGEFMARLRQGLKDQRLPAEVMPAGNLAEPGREGWLPPQLVRILGEDLATLRRLAKDLTERLGGMGGYAGIMADGAAQSGQLQVKVDREAAAALGVTVQQVSQEAKRAVAGEVAGKLVSGGKETDIRVRLRLSDRTDPVALGELPLAGPKESIVRLRQAARLEPGEGPEEVLRQERRRAVLVRGQVVGEPFSTGQARAMQAAALLEAPQGYEVRPGLQAQALSESLGELMAAMGLALMLIYVILVVQFESLRWPLVILLGLPPLAFGPAAALWLSGLPVTALVLLGGVVLLGMAVNTSILLVDYTNQLRAQGVALVEALVRAAQVRRRPILMTTLTTVLGTAPLALGWGAGATLGRPLALTALAGLVVSIVVTLLLIPALYRLLAGRGANAGDASDTGGGGGGGGGR